VEGPGAGSEIWTTVTPVADRETDVDVRFHIPGVSPERLTLTGEYFVSLYTRLWDEDEAMMRRRQEVLDGGGLRARPAAGPPLPLGPAAELRRRAPLVIEAEGVPLRIVARGDALLAYAFVCPHLGGPVDEDLDDGCVRCPWHGYRFDPESGDGLGGHRFRLPFVRRVEVDPVTGEAHLPRAPVPSRT
jgi:nitrite reductase/ring-hydroxylating ferredoxin subunit